MQELARVALRIAAVIGIVLSIGGATCMMPVSSIDYVPGYGYVVTVEERGPTIAGRKEVYYVFETAEEARAFYDYYHGGAGKVLGGPTGSQFNYRRYSEEDDPVAYREIEHVVEGTPLPTVDTPDLPQPIPPTPQ